MLQALPARFSFPALCLMMSTQVLFVVIGLVVLVMEYS